MKALNRKLYRDILNMKGQVIAIVFVLAAGISMFIMSISTYRSLFASRENYYQSQRFAEVFSGLKSASRGVLDAIAAIPGVARVHGRIVRDVTLDIEGLDEVASGRMISLRLPYRPGLNDPYLREGRPPEPGEDDGVLISEPFALANGFQPGDSLTAIINGKRQRLKIVGIALSPEYIFTIKPGDVFPDNQRFGILWISEKALEAAFNMEGAFNDVSLQLARGASLPEVIARLNRLLEPYGGLDAIGRKDQLSHWFLDNEFKQLRTMGYFLPFLFFSVAIFLLNIVLSRLIRAQRAQIGVLKAFGYGHWDIGMHFLKFVVVIVILATWLGIMAGSWLGSNLTGMYGELFSFPELSYHLGLDIGASALLLSLLTAVLGSLAVVRRAAALPPAEAMRPEPPATYKPTLAERWGLGALLSTQLRMIARHLERQPVRSLLTTLGIALATGLMVVGRYNVDAIEKIIEVQFSVAQRQDVNVTFYDPKAYRAIRELESLPGVFQVEPLRTVPVRLRHEHHSRRTGILGIADHPQLQRPLNVDLRVIATPPHGLIMGRKLAEVLALQPGDLVNMEVLEGARPRTRAQVVGLVDEFIGANVYMNLHALNRLMGEDRSVTGAYMTVDSRISKQLFSRLKNTPGVAGVTLKTGALNSFRETMAENIQIMTLFNIIFSCIIAFGVVYNSAQMSLTERSRDLATLRVLGFTRAEISSILLGELAIMTLVAIPLGFWVGYGFSAMLAEGFQTELFRLPMVISPQTYGLATLVILVSALISGLVVRRKLDRLDLLAVLKTRK